MVVLKNSVVIECTPEQAFDYLSNHQSELEWNPACREMVKLTAGPIGLGTTYRAKWSNSPRVQMETVAFQRPRSWTMHASGPIEVSFTCTLEEVPEGARLTSEFTPTPHGWFRLIFPMFLKGMRRQEQQNMVLIKAALERRAQRAVSAEGP